MPWNGSGVFSRIYSWVADAAAAIDINATRMDTDTNDIATALNNCRTLDGQTKPTAALPMNGFNHTGVGNGTATAHYAAVGQIQSGGLLFAPATGTADAITAAFSPATAALTDGEQVYVRASAANATTTPTFAPDGLTAHTITRFGGAPLAVGDIVVNQELILRCNAANTRWELLNPHNPSLRDTSAAFDVTVGATSSVTLTAGRSLTVDVANASRTLKLTGNAVLNQDVSTSGSPTFTALGVVNAPGGAGQGEAITLGGSVTNNYAVLALHETATKYPLAVYNSAAAASSPVLVSFLTDTGTQRGSIAYNNGSGVVAYNTTSDYRLKTVSGPYAASGALIDAIPVHLGQMHGATMQRPMFIAHEVQSLAPWAVTGERDAVDGKGEIVAQQIDQQSLIPALWAEIKSLRARLKAAGIA